jgi:hypothetical protein
MSSRRRAVRRGVPAGTRHGVVRCGRRIARRAAGDIARSGCYPHRAGRAGLSARSRRHLFAPEVPPEQAYANDVVRTKRDEHGVTISSVGVGGSAHQQRRDLDPVADARLSRKRTEAARQLANPASSIGTPVLLGKTGIAYLAFREADHGVSSSALAGTDRTAGPWPASWPSRSEPGTATTGTDRRPSIAARARGAVSQSVGGAAVSQSQPRRLCGKGAQAHPGRRLPVRLVTRDCLARLAVTVEGTRDERRGNKGGQDPVGGGGQPVPHGQVLAVVHVERGEQDDVGT